VNRISVVIPTFDRAALVGRAIESALAQRHPADEIVVVDDGSTDGTPEVLARYAGKIRAFRQPNRGGAAARNHGVREAACEWIAFLDSDDLWPPDYLERMHAAIEATRGAAHFYFADTELATLHGDGSLWQRSGFAIAGPHELAADPSPWALRSLQPMMLQSAVFRADVYRASGGLWERLVRRHDTHLFLKLALAGPACAVAGGGCAMTSDDRSATRLTVGHGGKSRVYWECTAALYADAAERAAHVPAALRAEIRSRLGFAHWRLARLALAERRFGTAAGELARALRAAPGELALRPLRALRRKRA
jgi:glycosyltransferase involved in cell wall biosynthesis